MPSFLDLGSANLNFLLGPQTDPTTDTENAAVVRFSGNTRTDPLTRAPATIAQDAPMPWAVSTALGGTVSYDGGATITGVGTAFLTDFPGDGKYIIIDIPAAHDPAGEGYRIAVLCHAPTTDTSMPINTILGQTPWVNASAGTVTGATYHKEVSTIGGAGFGAVQEVLMYYDLGFALYQSAYKHAGTTDGATLMANADAVAKLWWSHPLIQTARRGATTSSSGVIWQGSRHEALGTLLGWALRGCPGADFVNTPTNIFAYSYNVALASYNQWLAGKGAVSQIAFDVRDGGYALHWLTMLAVVHPDSTVRADCLSKALDAALNYFIRLQYPDGTWRCYQADSDNSAWWNATTGTLGNVASQPFLAGLLLESLVDLHRAIRTDPTYTAQAATILAAIKLGVEGAYFQYGGSPDFPGYGGTYLGTAFQVRGMPYSYGDSTLGYDATTYQAPVPGRTDRWNDPAINVTTNAPSQGLAGAIAASRFMDATTTHAPYYAALYETNATKRATYLAFGEELFKAQWEYTDGDGYRSQWYTAYPKNKDWDEHMRAQMRGLAWRKMAVAGLTAEDITGGGGGGTTGPAWLLARFNRTQRH